MEKEKPPMRELITSSIRLPEDKAVYIKEKSTEIGISQNAFMMVLIDLGIRLYESQAIFNLPKE